MKSHTNVTFIPVITKVKQNPAYMIGNIVSRYISTFPTTLQIALGVLMRDSKSLIQQLNEFGVTCAYDEVLQFKKSSAIAATEDIKLRGISDSKSSMIKTVVDIFDADISSQNGKLSTHSLAVLMTQTMKTETPNETSR